jgi:hypothetical protein
MSAIPTMRHPPPPAFFSPLLQTKALSLIVPSVALARRLGGPWATLGPPKPNPKQAEGRGFQGFEFLAESKEPNTKGLSTQLLLSKTVQRTTFSLWSEFPTLPFCSPFCQAGMRPRLSKNCPFRGWSRHFMPSVKAPWTPPCAAATRFPARASSGGWGSLPCKNIASNLHSSFDRMLSNMTT